ncbi:hypothetical protein XENTR_v10019392 [Xenopus tropicalis]|nr:hypothetical protein XENTR_v10019392 [Xenopus tropicalis]
MIFILLFIFFSYILILNPVAASKDCVKCDRNSGRVEKDLDDFFYGQLWEVYQEYTKVRDLYRAYYQDIMKPYKDKHLDPESIKELVNVFRLRLKAIEKSDTTGIQLIGVLKVEMNTLKLRVDEIFDSFEAHKCANMKDDVNCGFLEEKVIKCSNCEEETIQCVGGKSRNCSDLMQKCPWCVCQDGKCYRKDNPKKKCKPCPGYMECLKEIIPCATRNVIVQEDGDFYFNCFVEYHSRIWDQLEYVLEKKVNGKMVLVKTVDAPKLVKYLANKDDAGDYTCTARSKASKFVYGSVDIIVKGKYSIFISLQHIQHSLSVINQTCQ